MKKVDLSLVNSAYIALVSKKENPKTPNDFEPISLMSMWIKVLTKILANGVQRVIIPIVSVN